MNQGQFKFYKPLLALLCLALLFASASTQRQLNRDRDSMGLTRISPLENAPPILAFTTVALGGFRGIIANALWIRATELQEADKYFEMVQLADWITKLQPHFTTVWVHQAWNMAYNISIKFQDPRDRWMWVKRAIELLRDDALRYNPNEPLLYRELGWFYQHKMGHFLDDAHNSYKQYWAAEMDTVFSTQRPDFKELINPSNPESAASAKRLREVYKIDPEYMQKVDTMYGPLEWRLPDGHAIYWATLGLEKTAKESLKKEDFITLRRIIFQSLQLAFHRGKLLYAKNGDRSSFVYGPNLEIVKQASDAYEEMADLEPDKNQHILTGHRNFLGTAVYFLYTHNRMSAAKKWFDYLKQKYPVETAKFIDLDSYALGRVTEDVGENDPNRVQAILEGMLESSLVQYAMDDDEQGLGYELFARKIWKRYADAISDPSSQKRVALPPIEEMKKLTLERVLSPDFGLDPILVAQLRTKLNLPPPSAEPAPVAPTPSTSAGNTNSLGTNLPAPKK